MVRHAPIHRRSGHSDIAICCGRNVRGSSPSTSVVPLSNQVTTLNHKRFKGFKMFSDGHLGGVMRVQFWGTRGSIAKPGSSTARYGGNTSCIEVRSARGTLVIIDCGTGAHALGQKLMSAGLKGMC